MLLQHPESLKKNLFCSTELMLWNQGQLSMNLGSARLGGLIPYSFLPLILLSVEWGVLLAITMWS